MMQLRRFSKNSRSFCTSAQKSASSSQFINNVIAMCPNDGHTWNYHRKPDIDPNTVVFETYYGQSSMLTVLNYDDLINSDTNNNKNYKECVTSIINERIEAAKEDVVDLKQVAIGNVTHDIKNSIMNDDTLYGNAERTVNLTQQCVFHKENFGQFEEKIKLDELEKSIDFNYHDKSEMEMEFFSQVQESKYEFVLRRLNVNDVSNVAGLNQYNLYGNEIDFYLENCLTYENLPHFGVYKVLPPTSVFAARLGLIGCAFVHCANLSIGGIAVDSKYRGKGIGKALVYQCAKELINNNGFDICYSHYMEGNKHAKDFFKGIGWEEISTPHYWLRIGYDAHITY